MASAVSLTGSDTVNINGRVLNDLAEGKCVEIKFPNEIATVKTGKNGNAIFASNEMGKQCEVLMRLIRGSSDDKFMLGLYSTQFASLPGTPLLQGEFTKKIGDAAGNLGSDVYILSNGVFTKGVESQSSAEGESEQGVAVYTMKFSFVPRVIA